MKRYNTCIISTGRTYEANLIINLLPTYLHVGQKMNSLFLNQHPVAEAFDPDAI